jgi:hypothetical protein
MVMMIENGVKWGVVNKINNNELEVSTPFTYRGKEYYINKLEYGTTEKSIMYSISEKRLFGSSMNIDKITVRYISLFSYDMMSQRSNYKIAVEEMVFTVEKV